MPVFCSLPAGVCCSVELGCGMQTTGFPFRPRSAAKPGICFWFPTPPTWHWECQTDKSFCRGQLLAEGLLPPVSWHAQPLGALCPGTAGNGASLGAGQGKARDLTLPWRDTAHLPATTLQLPGPSSGAGQLAKATCSCTLNACQQLCLYSKRCPPAPT